MNQLEEKNNGAHFGRLTLMVPIDPWRNFTPLFGAVAFCTTEIDDFRSWFKDAITTHELN